MLETRPFPPSTRQLAIAFGVGQTWQSQRHFGARAVVGALAALGGLRDGLEPPKPPISSGYTTPRRSTIGL